MNAYERRQEARRERLLKAADKAEERSNQAYQASREAVAHIPLGQPILVGHHSERRHRRDLERSDNAMRRSIEEDNKAKSLRDRAAGVGHGGISADDPDAIRKLEAQIADAEARQSHMKAANKAIRKGDDDALRALGLTDAIIVKLKEPDFAGRIGYADYQLKNNNANIRRLKNRVSQLRKQAETPPAEDRQGEGWTLRENVEENRLQFLFDGKPSQEVRTVLKSCGFRWAPSLEAWQRQLNNAARYAAESVIKALSE
jgi:hypothetical protein